MEKLFELKPKYVDEITGELEHGVLYISKRFGIAIHLCACGCGQKSVTDLQPRWSDGWTITENEGLVTLSPSIGNFNGESPYHAHYFIRNNKIQWV